MESTFSRNMRQKMPGKWVRVENGVGPGFPDIVGVYGGYTVLVETKALRRGAVDCGLGPAQVAFHYGWTAAGGASWVVARIGERGAARLIVVRGDMVLPLRDAAKVEGSSAWIDGASLVASMGSVDWGSVAKCLIQW